MTTRHDGAATMLALAWQPALSASFDLGREVGRVEGYAEAEAEMARAWSAVAADVRAGGAQPALAELEARRAPTVDPCLAPACTGRCARCVRAEYLARRGQPYRGGPVSWTTGRDTRT